MKQNALTYLWKTGLLALLTLLLAAGLSACAEKQLSAADKSAIQNAMSTYIQEKTVADGGTYLVEGQQAQFDYLHDGVKVEGDTYISCADFKIGSDVYDLDYYVKKIDGTPRVMKEGLHKKNGEKVNRVLWQK